jgi:alcohol dehydrogenase
MTDPEIMASMPPALTAATGMDALSHNMEAFLSPKGDPLSVSLSRTGTELIGKSLVRAYRDGGDMEARTDMAFASCCGAWAFNQNSVGAPHPLGHQTTTRYGLPHGTACGIMYPAWLRLIRPYATDKLADLASALGVDTSKMSADIAADAAIEAFSQLYRSLDLPVTLREVGVEENALEDMSRHAMADFVTGKLDPYPNYNEEVLLELYKATW